VLVILVALGILATILLVLNVEGGSDQAALSESIGKIVFTSGGEGDREIYVVDPIGSNQTCLIDNSVDDFNPDWGMAP
jgi:Tol biopolymer transport system component